MSSIAIDFARWNVSNFEDFQKATADQDLETQVRLMVSAITRWEFEEEVSFDNLLDMPYGIISSISELFAQMFQEMLNEPVKAGFLTDLSGIKVRHFLTYQKALSSFDVEKVFDMISSTVKNVPKGFPIPATLEELRQMSVEDFFQYIRAINEAFAKKQNAKN